MNVKRWIARREPSWGQLDKLLRQAEKRGLKTLSARDIERMSSLYRSVSADSARAQTQEVGQTLVRELQNLTSRSYSQIYQGSRRQEWRSLWRFYAYGFPAVVRDTWVYWAIATGLFLLGTAIGGWYAWRDPSFVTLVTSPELVSQVRDDGELWMGSILGYEPLAASGITINNLSVCFRAIAGGITGGLFTTFVLLLNGLLIGSISTLVAQNNLAVPFWAFVFPHGSLELPAIFLAGGAGLLIGRGLLFPGSLRRIVALKRYGLQAAQLTYGIIPLLLIAGAIEGFFSPNPAFPDLLKYAVGILLFALLVGYCSQSPASRSDR